MLRIIVAAIVLIASLANADGVDVEALCKIDIEREKTYSSIPEDNLNKIMSTFESLKKLSELEELTGRDYHDTVKIIAEYRNVEKSEAELIVLKMYRNIELARMRRAAELRSVDDPEKWEKEFDKCVFEANNTISGQGD